MIDKFEFMSGLGKLSLNFGPDSLNLSEEQQAALLAHMFQSPDAHGVRESLPPVEVRLSVGGGVGGGQT